MSVMYRRVRGGGCPAEADDQLGFDHAAQDLVADHASGVGDFQELGQGAAGEAKFGRGEQCG